jgi:hypothetical protein
MIARPSLAQLGLSAGKRAGCTGFFMSTDVNFPQPDKQSGVR